MTPNKPASNGANGNGNGTRSTQPKNSATFEDNFPEPRGWSAKWDGSALNNDDQRPGSKSNDQRS